MLELSIKEKSIIKHFINTNGYIFNFSTSSFDAFTYQSIGIKLCQKYGMSKGKSFEAFVDESKTKTIIILIKNLLDYYDIYLNDIPEHMKKFIECQQVKTLLHDYEYLLDKVDTKERPRSFKIKPYDVFISHASIDKLAAVNDIRNELNSLGINVWYDSDRITWGDSLKHIIDDGLQKCEFGIIVISRTYFKSKWCNKELQSLVERNANDDRKVILPLLLNVEIDEAIEMYPFLEDIKMIEYVKGQEKDIALLFAQVLIHRLKEVLV